MIDDNHVCFCPLLQAKRTIWNIPSLPRIRFFKKTVVDKDNHFSKPILNFRKKNVNVPTFPCGPEIGQKMG